MVHDIHRMLTVQKAGFILGFWVLFPTTFLSVELNGHLKTEIKNGLNIELGILRLLEAN